MAVRAGLVHPPRTTSLTAQLSALPPRRLHGVMPALLLIAAATAATGMNLLVPFTTALPLLWAVVIVLAAVSVTFGIRGYLRAGRLGPAIEAILPSLGVAQPTRELVDASRWSSRWVGVPERVRVRYSPLVDDTDPRFLPAILGGLSRKLDVSYRVRRHDTRRSVLEVEIAPPPVSRAHQRAIDVVQQVVDPTANVTVKADAAGVVTRIEVKHTVGPRMAIPARRHLVEKVVSSMLPGRWRATWDLEADRIVFEIRPTMPDLVLHEVEPAAPLTHAVYKAFTVPIGPDEDGRVQVWQPSVSPHCLVIGGTGSGKTTFQHTVLTHLAHAHWRVWVLDGKRIEFAGFRDWPNVELVGARVEHQVRMLHAVHELMEERYTLLESGQARLEDFDPLALIIDEYATFKARVQRWYKTVKPKGAPTQAPVLDLMADLARLARSAKIHMLLGLQRPDVEFLGGEMRDNFGARVSFGRLSPQGANMMWDSFATGVGIPRNKRGRGIALNAESVPVEVQALYTPDPSKLDAGDAGEWAHLAALRPPGADYPRMMIRDPEPEDADEDGALLALYGDWAAAPIVAWDAAAVDTVDSNPPMTETPRVRRGLVRFHLVDDADETPVATTSGSADGYGDALEIAAGDLEVGDLLLIEPELQQWAVVEGIEPDVLDDEQIAIEYRDLNSGEDGLLTISDAEMATARRPEITD